MKKRKGYTWANAPLKFHKFYCVFLWIQLVLLFLILLGNLIRNRGNATPFVLTVTCLEVIEFLVFILYAAGIRKFSEIGHLVLFIYWGVRLLLYITLAFGGKLIYGSPYSIGGLMETMLAGTFIILYYHRRRKLFYTTPHGKHRSATTVDQDMEKDTFSRVHFPKSEKEPSEEQNEADASSATGGINEADREREDKEEPAVAAFVYCKACGAKTPIGRSRCRACKAPLEES